MHNVGDLGDLHQRLGKGAHILDKRLNITHADAAPHRQVTAQYGFSHIAQITMKVIMGIIMPERKTVTSRQSRTVHH